VNNVYIVNVQGPRIWWCFTCVCLLLTTGCMSRLDDISPGQHAALDTELDTDLNFEVGSAATASAPAAGSINAGASTPTAGTPLPADSAATHEPPLAPGCDNAQKDPSESDVDCGGACGACRDGRRCGAGAHCESGVCNTAGFCEAPSCNDGTKNGEETALDCGGGTCLPCTNGASCEADRDCTTGYCKAGSCADARCGDGIENGEETDVDCGGLCPPCIANQRCQGANDCESFVCVSSEAGTHCRAAACDDATQNGDETDVDCGGSCNPCGPAETCASDADCSSNLCAEVCLVPACSDGVHNGDESDVDCGGSCGSCGVGEQCGDPADCESGICSAGSCALAEVGGNCTLDADCTSGHCAGTCQPGGVGAACHDAGDCLTNSCNASQACGTGDFKVQTQGDRGGTDRLFFNAWITLPQPIPWNDLVFLYFFTPDSIGTYVGHQYNGPGSADPLALQLLSGDWMLVWRSTSAAPGPTNAEEWIDFQMLLANNTQTDPFLRANDYSQVAGAKVMNDRVVVCQRHAGRWTHVAGIAPTSAGDACAQVVESCEAASAPCESIPLQ
jgi:hypothetical protein